MSDAVFTAVSDGARLAGTFAPGQEEVSFRFQLPNPEEDSAHFRFTMPPHVAELRVMAESSPGMQLSSAGFESAQLGTNRNGQRLQTIRKVAARGERPLDELVVELAGIPTPGAGRWIAVAIALGLFGFGITVGLRRKGAPEVPFDQAQQARMLLLAEIAELDRAKAQERIGPRTHGETRGRLLQALARLHSFSDRRA
jgi:hypothetical protein